MEIKNKNKKREREREKKSLTAPRLPRARADWNIVSIASGISVFPEITES